MSSKTAILGITLVLAAGAAPAEEQPRIEDSYVVYGAGTATCVTWLQAHQEKGAMHRVISSWTQGFLSAASRIMHRRGGTVSETDRAAMDTWMDKYCVDHPFDTIAVAAYALFNNLSGNTQP